MRKLFAICVAGILLVLMLPMASAGATPPSEVRFHYEFDFVTGEGTFTASGLAVDAGDMCPSGTFEEVLFRSSHGLRNITTVDKFICDGSEEDTFIMKAQIHFPEFVGRWVIMEGTGAFEGIHGTGTVDGAFTASGVDETRAGQMHHD